MAAGQALGFIANAIGPIATKRSQCPDRRSLSRGLVKAKRAIAGRQIMTSGVSARSARAKRVMI